ncbi:M48 family metalloprotease [Oceanibacterium hippocampi]|uniref:TPR repeat-containing protein YfgC n=1 Tax=Oceanibacterium hippocampi TaxID=745714 RepID=A0A1Y5SUW6_9PROT|nr:M48 family metalloprotease [Oceanibacterium hippocampi]SLN48957.1 TPR repeat-containing protein YfgC precursor [Oceanibacterium hippocampi]
MTLLRRFLTIFALFGFLFADVTGAFARPSLPIIRDAEIEDTIRLYSLPIFEAAGLDSEVVRVHLVKSDSINAFVAGGQRIFLFTGLIMRTEKPDQLMGVIAHETGHIAGGHLARGKDAIENATTAAIIGYILGAAAIVAGAGQAGSAIILGGQGVAQQNYLRYSQTQEASADQAAISYLDNVGVTGKGMIDVLELLGEQEMLLSASQDPYARTHPLSRDRIAALERRVNASPYAKTPNNPDLVIRHDRMRAKLIGFIKPLNQVLQTYPTSDTSLVARYARAIAYHLKPDFAKAAAEMDSLLAEWPDDPYFWELKGQMLFENGKIEDSLEPLAKSVRLAPASPLLRLLYARALIATERPEAYRQAIGELEEVVRYEPDNRGAWQQLAIALGRDDQLGLSALASAEQHLLGGNKRDARIFAQRAIDKLPEGTPSRQRADDILAAASKPE